MNVFSSTKTKLVLLIFLVSISLSPLILLRGTEPSEETKPSEALTADETPHSSYIWVSSVDDWVYKRNMDFSPAGENWDSTYGYPQGLEYLPDNNRLYIVDRSADVLACFTTAGVEEWSEDISGFAGDAYGLARANDYWWIADAKDDVVYKVDNAGAYVADFGMTGGFSSVEGAAWDGTYLWIVDVSDAEVYSFDISGITTGSTTIPNVSSFTVTGATSPTGLAWDGTYFWISDGTTDEVWKVDSTGSIIAGPFDFNQPEGLAYDPSAAPTKPGQPILVTPENDFLTEDNTPYFEWENGAGNDNHRIEVDNDSDFSSMIDNVTVFDNNWTKPADGYETGTYYWRVWAVNAQGENMSENTWQFTIGSWSNIEEWTGTVNTTADWVSVETWSGIVNTLVLWATIAAWVGTINAPVGWNKAEEWSGTFNAPVGWIETSTWSGTINTSARWATVEEWSGTVKTPIDLNDWQYSRMITIDSGKIDNVLINFPVIVFLDNMNFDWTEAMYNGYDIRFSDNENNVLKYERERHDNDIERAEYHVKIPYVDNVVDTIFRMYWGNPGVSDGADSEEVWDDNFIMVQHMTDITASTIEDSTSNNNDGTKLGADEPKENDGKIYKAQDFDGSNDSIDITDIDFDDVDEYVLEAWIKTDNDAIWGEYAGSVQVPLSGQTGPTIGFTWGIDNGKVTYKHYTGIWENKQGTTVISDNNWHYIVFVNKGATKTMDVYVDGVLEINNQSSATDAHPRHLITLIGQSYGTAPNNVADAVIDEVRVSNITRSPAWVKASFYSGSDSLLTQELPPEWSAVETWSGTVNALSEWRVVNEWSGTLNALAAWVSVETWSGNVAAPVEWAEVESWSGTVQVQYIWREIEVWAGTINSLVEWKSIESWSGAIQALYVWNEIEVWTGTIGTPVGWSVVDRWSGTINKPIFWWDSNWLYRVPLTLDVSGGTPPENYQYKIVLDNVDDLGGHVAFENFQDLRFLENQNSGELAFWFENYIGSDNVVVWVRREDNSLSDNTIYVYYGNASAGVAENGFAVFPEFFDDFEDGDVSDWTTEGTAYIEAQTNIVKAGSYSGLDNGDVAPNFVYKTYTNQTSSFIIEFDYREEETSEFHYIGLGGTAGDYTNSVFLGMSTILEYYDGTDYQVVLDPFNADQWYKFKIAVHPASRNFDLWVDGDNLGTGLSDRGDISGGLLDISFGTSISVSYRNYFDQIFLRKYISLEPTASAGTEENAPILPKWNLIESWAGSINTLAAWVSIGEWSGTVQAPVAWHLIETWAGAVGALAEWNSIDEWTGTVSTTMNWHEIDTWSGAINAPVQWNEIETWGGVINAPYVWQTIEVWTGVAQAPYGWNEIEEWSGTVNAPVGWQTVEAWSGTVNALSEWNAIETWSGTVTSGYIWNIAEVWTGTINAPYVWKTIDMWAGTINAPVRWNAIDEWSGTIDAPVGWNLVEEWSGTVQAPYGWNLIDEWSGTVTSPYMWHTVETWSGTLQAPVGWMIVDEWTGTVETLVGWNLADEWNGTLNTLVGWNLIDEWTGTLQALYVWHIADEWTGTVNIIVGWNVVDNWDGTINAIVGWLNIDEWTGTINTFATWKIIDTWNGTTDALAEWKSIETWAGTISAFPLEVWTMVETWSGAIGVVVNWNVIETWNITLQTLVSWASIDVWNDAINAPVSWTNIDEWTGILNATISWLNIDEWNGTVQAFAEWTGTETWSGRIGRAWNISEVWEGVILTETIIVITDIDEILTLSSIGSVMVMGVLFTIFMLFLPNRRIIFGMLAMILWFVMSVLVATSTSVAPLYVLFLGLGLFSFFWVALLIAEGVTGKTIIGKTEEEIEKEEETEGERRGNR